MRSLLSDFMLNLYPALNSAEVTFLRNQGTSILVLYSGVASHISEGYPGGQTDGKEAVYLLETLQKSNGGISTCVIFADVEQANAGSSSSATIAGYFEGFCDAVVSSGNYTPGLYFPTGSSNPTFGCAYETAYDLMQVCNRRLFTLLNLNRDVSRPLGQVVRRLARIAIILNMELLELLLGSTQKIVRQTSAGME